MQDDHGAGRFVWRRWGDNGVVFDRRYGDTHTLSGAAAFIFDAWLASGSLQFGEFARLLTLGKMIASTPDTTKLTAALQELQQRGLLPSH